MPLDVHTKIWWGGAIAHPAHRFLRICSHVLSSSVANKTCSLLAVSGSYTAKHYAQWSFFDNFVWKMYIQNWIPRLFSIIKSITILLFLVILWFFRYQKKIFNNTSRQIKALFCPYSFWMKLAILVYCDLQQGIIRYEVALHKWNEIVPKVAILLLFICLVFNHQT